MSEGFITSSGVTDFNLNNGLTSLKYNPSFTSSAFFIFSIFCKNINTFTYRIHLCLNSFLSSSFNFL